MNSLKRLIGLMILLVVAGLNKTNAQDFNPKPFPDRVILTWMEILK